MQHFVPMDQISCKPLNDGGRKGKPIPLTHINSGQDGTAPFRTAETQCNQLTRWLDGFLEEGRRVRSSGLVPVASETDCQSQQLEPGQLGGPMMWGPCVTSTVAPLLKSLNTNLCTHGMKLHKAWGGGRGGHQTAVSQTIPRAHNIGNVLFVFLAASVGTSCNT